VTESTEGSPLRPEHFQRQDDSDDSLFYQEARLVTHIDDAAISAVTAFYRTLIPEKARVLDLMSSWVSHLPLDRNYAGVSGLGMNAKELDANAQLDERVVQDLNRQPALPFEDDSFDAAVVTVSIQYLTRPVEVFAEVGRVLKPGAPFAVAYSNRMFPTKAVALWRSLNDREHADVIGLYFRLSGVFDQPQAYDISPGPYSDPMFVVVAHKAAGASSGE
jgi:SAM-dependent methyltransferase